jgi:N-acetylglucosamine-6-phosphate deacetylase
MLDAVRYVRQTIGLDLADALAMATSTPARLLKIDDKFGRLKQGFRADLVHLGDDLSLNGVWVGGAKTPLPDGDGGGEDYIMTQKY